MSQDILLVSDQILKDRTTIHGNIDPKLIYPRIKLAQDKYIERLVGTALFDKLLNLVSSGDITLIENEKYKTLLDRYIIDTLIYYTLAEMPVHLSFQLWNKGVVRKQGEDTDMPSMSDIMDVAKSFFNDAEFYADRLRRYLLAKAPTLFPEYLNPGSEIDTIHPTRTPFTMPVFLGDDFCCPDKNDPQRFEKMYQGNQTRCCD